MNLNQTITEQRKAKGLTQQELADQTNIDLRTIQRIESGKSKPRAYTIKAIESALNIQLHIPAETKETDSIHEPEETKNFLQIFCLSCFSYLIIPYVHFLIPRYLLAKNKELNPEIKRFSNQIIRQQIYWVIATMLVFLAVLLYNFIIKYVTQTGIYISYLIPFFGMYILNIILISANISKVRRLQL